MEEDIPIHSFVMSLNFYTKGHLNSPPPDVHIQLRPTTMCGEATTLTRVAGTLPIDAYGLGHIEGRTNLALSMKTKTTRVVPRQGRWRMLSRHWIRYGTRIRDLDTGRFKFVSYRGPNEHGLLSERMNSVEEGMVH